MLSKRTLIGIIVGSAISAIGVAALVNSIGLQTISFDDTYGIGEYTSYQFPAPKSSHQFIKIEGDSFDVTLKTPADGIQIPTTTYKKEVSFDWYVLEEGINRIEIQNIGDSEIHVTGTFERNTDPIFFTYHILVITAGVVIIGFSAGFSIRKPKGF
ncbi:hypothetical protein C6988_09095 [Nitrosopumilus sp. b1]|uniref:hypothetical protein n=1 Tax=Nitrosopumilus sp. b1 TaxID=2109907 RepID=UPI0015F4DBEB|nr:hypothetical protein [Nitrosopumilus sp. b1]KAF6242365.1 hypothetical protein C6988_09095 [Nitrosopumilus sp. b1]